MTRENFIQELKFTYISYKMEGNKIVINNGAGGDVELSWVTSLPPDIEFRNDGYVFLDSLTSIPPSVEFRNQLDVFLGSLIRRWEGSFFDWEGNIRGIDSKKLLNKMVKDGLFDRKR
jgi:hypothetical protein